MDVIGPETIGEVMEFLGSVITIAVGLWVGQMLIDWWKNSGR